MATNERDVFAALRVGSGQPAEQPPAPPQDSQPRDVFAALRIPGTPGTPLPDIRRNDNTLGEEFVAGLGSGIDGMQGALYGVAGLTGHELGVDWLKKVGYDNAERNFEEAGRNGRESQGFTDIESAGGFFKWASASLGEAIPSLALAMTGGGMGVAVGRKALELGVKKSVAKSVERRMMAKFGFSREEALLSAREYMTSSTGQTALARAFTGKRTGAVIDAAGSTAAKIGGAAGAAGASVPPQVGAIDRELREAGIEDRGLTALMGGIVGGALEALPALRLMDKLFPGVDRQVSKAFVKDFAISTGTQALVEGGTEAAQEMIQLAALAYHDPTFDMFSPNARKRVIDAFAAGAIVGAVTGGGAEGIGAVKGGALRGVKVAVPTIGAWSMTAREKAGEAVESVLPEGFTPADKTVFEEIRGRVYASVQPHIEAAVNGAQAQVDKVTQSLNDNLEGGVNNETAKIADIVRAARNKFLGEHGDQIDSAKEFMDREIERIATVAKDIKNPEARAKFVEEHTAAVKEKLAGFVDLIRRKAAELNKRTEAEVDNMDLDDDLLAQLGIEEEVDETERRTGPSGRKFDRSVGPAVQQESSVVPKEGTVQTGDVDIEPTLTFGKHQKKPTLDADGKETVVGYDTKEQAEKGRATLRRRFRQEVPFSEKGKTQDDSFRIKRNPLGEGWIIEVINQDVKDTQKFFEDLKVIERDATAPESNERAVRVESEGFDGTRFGFQKTKKGFDLDVQSMAYKGKNLDQTASTDMDGFLAFAGEMLQRGMITNAQFAQLQEKATEVFAKADKDAKTRQNEIDDAIQATEAALKLPQTKASTQRNQARLTQLRQQKKARASFDERAQQAKQQEGDRDVEGNQPPVNYSTRGEAFGALAEFREELAEAYPELVNPEGTRDTDGQNLRPKNFFTTVKNADGTWSWGFNRSQAGRRIHRAFRAKNPGLLKEIQQRLDKKRRDEFQDKSARKEGIFSVNPVLTGSGDLGSRTGEAERAPDVDVTGRATIAQEEGAPTDNLSGQQDFGDVQAAQNDPRIKALVAKRKQLEQEYQDLPESKVNGDPADKAIAAKEAQIQVVDDTIASILGEVAPSTFQSPTGRRAVKTVSVLSETRKSQQSTDQATDPENLETEFEDRRRELEGTTRGKNTFTSRKAKKEGMEQTAHDNRILDRYGRKGAFRMLTDMNMPVAIQGVLNSIGHFVTKTLGLSNQVTMVDDHGLQLLIDQGLVSDPVFKETLENPNVHARNIRVGDQSFIYLSQKVLSDPAATVLAFSHEMGHHLYRVAWDKLTPQAQTNLRKAYVHSELNKTKDIDQLRKDVRRSSFAVGTVEAQNEMNRRREQIENDDAGFNEWMADQLAAWIARPIRQGGDPGQFFFQKVAQNIRKLYNFVKGNPRFQLDETFKQFADAVALKARTTTSQEANPYNDAQLKAWFRNEGVTMYQWFGDALETDNMDFAPATQQGKDALARMEKNFPAIVKRAIVLRNWVVAAYKMAVAPSTSAVRDIGLRIQAANQLVTIFNREGQGKAKVRQNYHQAVELMRGQFMDQFTTVVKGVEARIKAKRPGIKNRELQTLANAEMRKIGQSLQKKDGDPTATFTKEEQAVRDIFDAMHDYATKVGKLPVRKVTNYFPRAFSRELLVANKQKILNHLTDGKGMPLDKARSLYNSLIDPNATDGRATQDATETPGFTAMNSRQIQDKWFDQFLDDNTQGIVANYVNQLVKRAEFNRVLGEPMPVTELDAKEAIKKGIWDPKAKMHKILAEAKKQNATDEELIILEKYIDANLGQLGRDDIKPGMRKFMAGVMAYQNMRVLLFTVFASLPDLAGPAIRNGDMKGTWNTLKKRINEMATDDNALADMARSLGIVQDTVSEHIMTEYVDNHYMPAKLRKWNDNFFKYTGLNWYTDFTRKYALAVGIDYIEQSYNNFVTGKTPQEQARGKDMLAELGLTPAEAKKWLKAGKPTYDSTSHDMNGPERKAAEALVQFVDESIMRPNASQRPILASHPGAMLVYHLKGYMYAVHDIILKRIKFNIDESQTPAQYAAAIAPAIAMMLLTAVGLELRELIQYAGSNRKPPTDRMDGWEYTWELAQRSGLTGFAQIGIDLEGAEDRGMSHVAGIGGPALSQAANIISRPSTQTIPKAIPVIGQIPAARSMVRDVIK